MCNLILLGQNGGAGILESSKAANFHMKTGGLGVAILLMKAHDVVDVVKVILPSAVVVRQAQGTNDWGELWVEGLRLALEQE